VVKGVFSEWQPLYAESRIATFPVNADKRPAIRRWNQITLRGSARLAERFHEADAFGFQLGPKSRITALDIDSQDEAILADALTYHGDTPFIVRTGGGYHAYYSYAGERRLIRPYNDKPVDILGGGFVVAPPSVSAKGTYQIICGNLDDLANLPPIHVVLDGLRHDTRIPEGKRNNTLFRFALEQARHSDTYDSLLDVMRTRNMDCEPPLPDEVIITTAKSAWRYEQDGRNLVGRGRAVVTPHSVVDELIGESQDAFVLFSLLQRHHWGRNFVLANAMADQLGWTRKRFAAARVRLQRRGFIQLVMPASYRTPAVYRLGAWGGQY
jgi:Bifunctional DNA primase/polymerase, N-terminal/Primase C terminal 1 (PriCT-1)